MVASFDPKTVFKDVDSIPVGSDFRLQISSAINSCQIFLAVIGPSWRTAKDQQDQGRLDDSTDVVRLELEQALSLPTMLVVPVLVGGAVMPKPEELPESLRKLSRLQAAVVRRDPDFHLDMDRLVEGLRAVSLTTSEKASAVDDRKGVRVLEDFLGLKAKGEAVKSLFESLSSCSDPGERQRLLRQMLAYGVDANGNLLSTAQRQCLAGTFTTEATKAASLAESEWAKQLCLISDKIALKKNRLEAGDTEDLG